MNGLSIKFMPLLISLVACSVVPSNNRDATVLSKANEINMCMISKEDVDASYSDSKSNDVTSVVDDNAAFIEYIFTAMKSWVPPTSQCFWNPNKTKYQSCIDDATNHYHEVAQTIVEVVSEPDIQLPFTGHNTKVKTALLMASIASTESRFEKKVDSCQKVGDNGLAFGLWQTHSGRAATCKDRASALKIAIKIVNESFDYCKRWPLRDKLAAYASGSCSNSRGIWHSRRKINRAINYLKDHPFEK